MTMQPNEPTKSAEPIKSAQGRRQNPAQTSQGLRTFLLVAAAFTGGFGLAVLGPRLATSLAEQHQKPENQVGQSTWDEGSSAVNPQAPATTAGLDSKPPSSPSPTSSTPHEGTTERSVKPSRVTGNSTAEARVAQTRPLKVVHMVKPSYPAMAKAVRLQGSVDVVVKVDEKGVPIEASSSKAPALLQQAAMDAATDWRFRPALRNGKAVRADYTIRFDFKLTPDQNLTASS